MNPAGPWHRSRWLRNGLLLPLWFLNAWLVLRLLAFLQPFLTIFVFALVLALVLPPLVDQGRQLLEALPSWLDSSAGLLSQIQERFGIPPESAAPVTVLRGVADKLSGMARGVMTFLTLILTVFLLVGIAIGMASLVPFIRGGSPGGGKGGRHSRDPGVDPDRQHDPLDRGGLARRAAAATNVLTVCYSSRNTTKQAMPTDYTAAVAGLIATCLVLTGMVVFVLSRPSDLEPLSR